MKRWISPAVMLTAMIALFAIPAAAQDVILLDYAGFAYETGGLPPSSPGDVLVITSVVTDLDALFGVDLGVAEATVYIYGLVSTGDVFDPGSGVTTTGYIGGTIEVYEDLSQDHDWGVCPPNAELSTFTNGTLLFEGDFTSFVLQLTAAGAGFYEGNIDGVGGTVATLCDGLPDCAYTLGGAFSKDANPQLPPDDLCPGEGYDLQIDGTLSVDVAVPTETVSFGTIKAKY